MSMRGFTYLELLVVLAIVSLLAVMTSIAGAESFETARVQDDRDTITGALYRARAQAMLRTCGEDTCASDTPRGVRIESDRLVIFSGDSFQQRKTRADEVHMRASDALVQGNPEFIFHPGSGNATSGEVVLSQGSRSLSISVNELGLISTATHSP